MHDWVNSMTKDLYGWTIEDKLKQMKIRERYMPLVKDVMKSKEFKAYTDFTHDYFRSPEIRKIGREVEWLARDIERFPASDFRIEPPRKRTHQRRHDTKPTRKCDRHGKCYDVPERKDRYHSDYMSRSERMR